jgi:type I restriction enzyme S subunit
VLALWRAVGGSLLDRSFNAAVESAGLVHVRDYLLPKLLSGEVRVRDAEKLVSEVA